MKKLQYKFYALTFPSEFTLEQALDFFDSLSTATREHLVFELWSDKYGIKHRIGIPWQQASYVMQQLGGAIYGTHIKEDEREFIPRWTHAVEVGVSDNTRPFNVTRAEAQSQRIHNAAISDMNADDILLIQWVVSPGQNVKGPAAGKDTTSSHWALKALWSGVKADSDEIAERRANAAQNQYRATLRVAAYSKTYAHGKKLVDNVRRAYKVPETASVHFTNRWYVPMKKRIENINRGAGPGMPIDFINATEVAVFTWPVGKWSMPGMVRGKTKPFPPNEIVEKTGRVLGVSTAPGYENRRIAVTPEGGTRHTYVIGPSGLGKSTLLGNMLQQDVERGHGVIVFDGKGDLIASGLDSVPRERVNDTVFLNFQDYEYPIGFNILQEGDPRSVVDDLMSLFLHNAGGDIYLREVLYHGLHTMRAIPGLTVVDLLPFLDPKTPKEEAWRDYVIAQLPKNGQLYGYWKAFYALKPTERMQKVRPVQNRLWQITNRADLRNMLGQSQSTISIRDILNDNKIMFVSIPQNLGSETVSLLGAIMFDAIWQQVQALNMSTPTNLYIDEVQRFLNLPIDLNDMLSTARSKNLGLVLAHQYVDQLPKELFSAVTNASTKVAFKLEGPDASKMANLFGRAVTPEDFINLDKYEVLARVATPGGSSDPLTIRTLEGFKPHGLAAQVVKQSRSNFGRRADDIDAEIEARRVAPDKPRAARPVIGDRPKSNRGGATTGVDE